MSHTVSHAGLSGSFNYVLYSHDPFSQSHFSIKNVINYVLAALHNVIIGFYQWTSGSSFTFPWTSPAPMNLQSTLGQQSPAPRPESAYHKSHHCPCTKIPACWNFPFLQTQNLLLFIIVYYSLLHIAGIHWIQYHLMPYAHRAASKWV